MEASKIFFYARGTRDQDMRRSQGSGLLTRAVALHSRADSAIRAFEPERLAAPAFTMRTLAKSPLLKPHARYLRSLLRRRPHVLSAREEALLAKLRPALGSAPGIFQTLMGPELPFVEVTLADGRRQRLS